MPIFSDDAPCFRGLEICAAQPPDGHHDDRAPEPATVLTLAVASSTATTAVGAVRSRSFLPPVTTGPPRPRSEETARMGKEGEPLANRPTAAPSDQARHHCWTAILSGSVLALFGGRHEPLRYRPACSPRAWRMPALLPAEAATLAISTRQERRTARSALPACTRPDQGHRCKPSARVAFRIAAIVAPSGRFPA